MGKISESILRRIVYTLPMHILDFRSRYSISKTALQRRLPSKIQAKFLTSWPTSPPRKN